MTDALWVSEDMDTDFAAKASDNLRLVHSLNLHVSWKVRTLRILQCVERTNQSRRLRTHSTCDCSTSNHILLYSGFLQMIE